MKKPLVEHIGFFLLGKNRWLFGKIESLFDNAVYSELYFLLLVSILYFIPFNFSDNKCSCSKLA